ncbi:MAG TPA: membrane protein insertase YidC [Myxococcota bacterium]|nr:membrane protein insertase YidC [Myxococcota bacterium]
MERNFLLALALSFLVLTLWTFYTAPPAPPPGAPPAAPAPSAPEGPESPGLPAPAPAAPPTAVPVPAPSAQATPQAPAQPAAEERVVALETDRVRAAFTTRGGGLVHWQLREWDDAYLPGRPRVELTTFDPTREVALFTPFEELGGGDLRFAPYVAEQDGPLAVEFRHSVGGVEIRKRYALEPDSYLLSLRIALENRSDRLLRPTFQVGWPTVGRPTPDWTELSLAAYVDGSAEHLRLAPGGAAVGGFFGGSAGPVEHPSDVDWAGADTRYFLAALLPEVPRDAGSRLIPGGNGRSATAEIAQVAVNLPPGQTAAREYRVYLGPKESERLEAAGANLDQAIQKGWFPALTDFFTAVLVATHRVIPNYGIAIILITVVVRLLMYPVMQRQMQSMKRMSAIQPRLKEVQEKYADDRQKQSEEMMKLYRESGFNPLSGCLPMLLQLPVFIGLYYALQGSIQLRQEPFFGWIHDLAAPEALFVVPGLELPVRLLPILMGGSMVLQARLTPTTVDPAQARMMNTIMPVMFTFMFYQFASGLVLYWLVSNLLGIGQQLLINRSSEAK